MNAILELLLIVGSCRSFDQTGIGPDFLRSFAIESYQDINFHLHTQLVVRDCHVLGVYVISNFLQLLLFEEFILNKVIFID